MSRPHLLQALTRPAFSILVRRLHRRYPAQANERTEQEQVRRTLLHQIARTAYGKQHGVEAGDPGSFARLPLVAYEDLIPWIEQSKAGAPDILAPGPCPYFAVSSGTTAGRTKYLPVNAAMLRHFRQTGLDSLLFLLARQPGLPLLRGRHLFLGGSTELLPLPGRPSHSPAWSGDLSGITAREMPWWVDRLLYEPGRQIAAVGDWPTKIETMIKRVEKRSMTLMAGIPSWMLIVLEKLRERFEARTGGEWKNIRSLWPDFCALIHGGVPFGPYRECFAEWLGPEVVTHEVYPASEAFIALQDAHPEDGLRLLTRAGIFYEFLALQAYREKPLTELGGDTVPLEGVKTGQPYVLILTAPSGLSRYVIGDVVTFTSLTPPRLMYAGRTHLSLSPFGEHVIEKELTDALTQTAPSFGLVIRNFHVAPIFAQGEVRRGYHEWWIGTESILSPNEELSLAGALDEALQRMNEDYEAKRQGQGMAPPRIRLVQPDTFNRWMADRNKFGGQNKMPRCRNDRQIADALAALASSPAD